MKKDQSNFEDEQFTFSLYGFRKERVSRYSSELIELGGDEIETFDNIQDAIRVYDKLDIYVEDGIYHGYSIVANNEDGAIDVYKDYSKGETIEEYEDDIWEDEEEDWYDEDDEQSIVRSIHEIIQEEKRMKKD